MIDEALLQSVVRNVVQRLQDEGTGERTSANRESVLPAPRPQTLEDLHQSYRVRHIHASPFEERILSEFDSSLPVELGKPLVCLYEKHRPCDSCGRCEVRGF